MDSLSKKRIFSLLGMLWFFIPAQLWCASHSESMGVVFVKLEAGSVEAPSFSIFSPGVKQSSIYRGPVKSVSENNVTFYRTPDLANPANLIGPLPPGVLQSNQARAITELDENGSVSSVILTYAGSGYLDKPNVYISPPTLEKEGTSVFLPAMAQAVCDDNNNQLAEITIIEKGQGYDLPPAVSIEGGPHYLKIIDPDSSFTGLHFPLVSNTDHMVELNHSIDIDTSDGVPSVSEIFVPGLLVEVVKGWTLGSLFGYSDEDLSLQADLNSSRADWVYLLKDLNAQNRDLSDYVPHFHNGTDWKLVDSPTQTTSHRFIAPGQSIIIARRADSNTTLAIHGVAPQTTTSWYLPEFNRTQLVCNPFPTEIKVSDLIGNEMIFFVDEDGTASKENNTTLWRAQKDQDKADNIQILNSSGWSTFWHDGTNLNILEHAKVSARAGSGLGGALTQDDFSMASGSIVSISNPISGNVTITTSTNHGLKQGFWVTISSALGRLTNEDKDQIDANGTVVDPGDGLLIESPVNGKWEITTIGPNTFELKDSNNYADFVVDGQATWSTGSRGRGYDVNGSGILELSITGGNGFGARATAKVGEDGSISSINIIHGGLFYTHPPSIMVHPGGWKKLGSGNAPINDLTILPGSGALLIRKHPQGVRSLIPLRSVLQE